jgi:hypothetical protein
MMPGLKYDEGKLRYDLIDSAAEGELVKVLTYGATKYGPARWRDLSDGPARYYAAMRRHVEAWRQGEHADAESGLPHLAHAMCCVMFLLAIDETARKVKGKAKR